MQLIRIQIFQYRQHSGGFGAGSDETSTDYRACEYYGPLYK